MTCTHETIDCPEHAGAYDCTPFCNTCEGSQGYCPICDVTAWDKHRHGFNYSGIYADCECGMTFQQFLDEINGV